MQKMCWLLFLAFTITSFNGCAFLKMNGLSSLSRKSQLPGLARLAALRIANAKKIQGSSDGRVAGISYFASNPLHNIHEHQSSDDPTLFSKEDSNPEKLTERYNALRDWIHRCLDTFRGELRQLLWPLYVHSFLFLLRNNHVANAAEFLDSHAQEHEPQHSDTIKRLRQCGNFNNASEAFGDSFLKNRYIIRISASSFELLLMFLDVRQYSLLRHFVQDYLDMRVVSQKPMVGSVALEGTSKRICTAHWPHEDNIENSDAVVLDPASGLSHPLRSVATDKLRELSQASAAVAETQVENPWVCMYTLFNPAANVTSMCIAQNGNSVVAAFEDGCFRHWDLSISGVENSDPPPSASLRPEFGTIFKGHSASIYSLDSFLGGRMILSASEDGTVMLWDMLLKSRLAIYRAHNLPVWGVSVSPGGFYFATFGRDGTARLWSTDCGNYLRLYVGHLADVCCAAWHPNCEYLITGSEDCTLRMFEVQTGNCVRLMIGHTSPVVSVSCSPNGAVAISAAENGEVIMWDLGSGQPISSLGQHRASATSCHFPSGSSSCAVTASIDGCVKIWDIKTARAMAEPEESGRHILYDFYTKNSPVLDCKFIKGSSLLFAAGYFKAE